MRHVLFILAISLLLSSCASWPWRNADCSRKDYLGSIWTFALFGKKEPPSTSTVRAVMYAIAEADQNAMHLAESGLKTVEEEDQREFLGLLLRYAEQQLDDPETCVLQRSPAYLNSVQKYLLHFEKDDATCVASVTLHEAAYIHLEEALNGKGKYSCPAFGSMADRVLP